jgi:hypothetical protein
MKETLELLDRLIEEHRQIMQKTEAAEQIAGDVDAIISLDKLKDDFMPGKPGEQQSTMKDLQNSLAAIEDSLQKHFSHEETDLMAIFKQHGDELLISGLHVLILEHEEILGRIAESRKEVDALIGTGFSREVMEGKAWGVRVYIGHTRKLIEAHAQSEQQLFNRLRDKIAGI